jgi:hypothetical protein
MSNMQQVIFCWNDEATRLWILWDNDQRESFSSLVFPDRFALFSHIASCANSWARDYDVNICSVVVKNPKADHQSWLIDWRPMEHPNARCITLS